MASEKRLKGRQGKSTDSRLISTLYLQIFDFLILFTEYQMYRIGLIKGDFSFILKMAYCVFSLESPR